MIEKTVIKKRRVRERTPRRQELERPKSFSIQPGGNDQGQDQIKEDAVAAGSTPQGD